MIAQALMNRPFANNDQNHEAMLEMALARIRQLSAHEIGHTIGFAHNFAASVNNDASVMDYPHPKFRLENGEIDFSEAYPSGIGEWDKITVKYSYADIPESASEKAFLNAVLAEAEEKGLQFISDSDARAPGGAHVNAHLWDNESDAAHALREVLKIREIAINNFSEDNIRSGEAYSVLEDVFVPLYFFHRYQTEATVKAIGGLDYNYAVKGGNATILEPVDRERQSSALEALLLTLQPQILAIPKEKLELFPPRAFGFSRSRESFSSNTGVAFDALGAPATASELSLSLLLHPQRAARLIQQKALDQRQLGLSEVIKELISNTVMISHKDPYLQEVQNVINYNVLDHLLNLAVHKNSIPQVKAVAHAEIAQLRDWLKKGRNSSSVAAMHLLRQIEAFEKDPKSFELETLAPNIPDGPPIGGF